jgi:hypothetical protein
MTTGKYVYATDDPTIVAAYETADRLFHDMMKRAATDALALGKNKGLLVLRGAGWGVLTSIAGLAPDDPDDPPAGWRYLKTRDRLEPQRGLGGGDARRWIADHQPGADADVRGVLETHGLPRSIDYCRDDQYYIGTAAIVLHDGTLWARFDAEAKDCTWPRRKLSEFYAAVEAAEDARQAAAEQSVKAESEAGR